MIQFRKSCIGLDEYDGARSEEGKGLSQNHIISNFPDGGSTCMVFCRTSAISLGHKDL